MKTGCNGQHVAPQIAVGLVVIVIGFLFLFDNLGWLDIDMGMQLWPIVLIAAGVLRLSQGRSGRGGIVGGALILAGVLLLLRGVGWLTIGWNVLGPVLLIGGGVLLLLRSSMRGSLARGAGVRLDKDGDAATGDMVDVTAVLGSHRRRMATRHFRGGDITVIMAGCDLDLREASIDSVAVLHVFALMGGINIKVPTDWTVELEGVPLIGGFEDSTLHPRDGGKRLIVRGYAMMGGLDLRN
jgi:predicted membrane protein